MGETGGGGQKHKYGVVFTLKAPQEGDCTSAYNLLLLCVDDVCIEQHVMPHGLATDGWNNCD